MIWETYSAVEHSDVQIIYSVHCSYPASLNPSPWGWGGGHILAIPTAVDQKTPTYTYTSHYKEGTAYYDFPFNPERRGAVESGR
jgi:hypothetical protein